MSTIEPLEEFLLEHHREGRDTFLRAHPYPVLVLQLPEGFEDGFPEDGTASISSRSVRRFDDATAQEQAAAARTARFRVMKIVKSNRNGHLGHITLGRSRANDIVLPNTSVSRVHAYFSVLPNGSFSIRDAKSRNGTHLNGGALNAEKTSPLSAGDMVTFGAVRTTFQTSSSFSDFLSGLFENS